MGQSGASHFFYTSLSFVSYAQGHTRDSRTLLRQALDVHGGMHAQGVVALAQLEESEGNIEQARKVYQDALLNYEKKRRGRIPYRQTTLKKDKKSFETLSLGDGHSHQYAPSYSGDKWINILKSWCRMEQIHGTYEMTHIVFGKAARLFPYNVSLLIQWAELQADHGEPKRAWLLYKVACCRVGLRSAEPYQLFAEFDIERKNFVAAQAILTKGAQAMSGLSLVNYLDGSVEGEKSGLAQLFHTWGVCECHLGTYSQAEQLFNNALRVTGLEEGDSAMRSLILYLMARLKFSRGEYLLAQHCIALSLKENLLPGGNSLTWKIWLQIAEKMGNQHLATRCKEQALLRLEEEHGRAVSDLSQLLGELDSKSSNGQKPKRTGSAMKDMLHKTPWHSKVCPASGRMDKNWHNGASLWNC
jgi:tetratricopeptide (TPR) repeat protein